MNKQSIRNHGIKKIKSPNELKIDLIKKNQTLCAYRLTPCRDQHKGQASCHIRGAVLSYPSWEEGEVFVGLGEPCGHKRRTCRRDLWRKGLATNLKGAGDASPWACLPGEEAKVFAEVLSCRTHHNNHCEMGEGDRIGQTREGALHICHPFLPCRRDWASSPHHLLYRTSLAPHLGHHDPLWSLHDHLTSSLPWIARIKTKLQLQLHYIVIIENKLTISISKWINRYNQSIYSPSKKPPIYHKLVGPLTKKSYLHTDICTLVLIIIECSDCFVSLFLCLHVNEGKTAQHRAFRHFPIPLK